MSVYVRKFDEILSVVIASRATKKNKHNFVHTWDAWVSKEVLHIVSRSGVARRQIWHFSVKENAGKNLFLKNTSKIADCWTMSAGKNKLEKVVFSLNPRAKVKYVDKINHILRRRGDRCAHSTSRGGCWWYITTDGEQEMVKKARTVKKHFNQHHIGCPTEPDDVLVTGGSYAINWYNKHQLSTVYVTDDADIESVILQIKVQDELWRILDYDDKLRDLRWGHNMTIKDCKNRRLELLKLAAQGKLHPEFVRRLISSVKPYQVLAEEVPQELYDRAMFYHPDSYRRRKLTDEIVRIISDSKTFTFRLAKSNQVGEILFVLPKGDYIDWHDDQFNTKLSDWGSCSSSGHSIDKNSSYNVNSLPKWAIKNIIKQCATTPLFELEHLPDNITMANDLIVTIYRKGERSIHDTNKLYVILKNGRDPNTGFGRVYWNPWYLS